MRKLIENEMELEGNDQNCNDITELTEVQQNCQSQIIEIFENKLELNEFNSELKLDKVQFKKNPPVFLTFTFPFLPIQDNQKLHLSLYFGQNKVLFHMRVGVTLKLSLWGCRPRHLATLAILNWNLVEIISN